MRRTTEQLRRHRHDMALRRAGLYRERDKLASEAMTFRTLHPHDGRTRTADDGAPLEHTMDRYVTITMPRVDFGGTHGERTIDWKNVG